MSVEIVTGDDVAISCTLKKNGATFTIDPGATVEASLIQTDHETVLLAPVAQSNGAAGADWANSLVVVEFTSSQTDIAFTGSALLEIQVDDSGKTTFFAGITMVAGTIA
jgi:hypothetical protein